MHSLAKPYHGERLVQENHVLLDPMAQNRIFSGLPRNENNRQIGVLLLESERQIPPPPISEEDVGNQNIDGSGLFRCPFRLHSGVSRQHLEPVRLEAPDDKPKDLGFIIHSQSYRRSCVGFHSAFPSEFYHGLSRMGSAADQTCSFPCFFVEFHVRQATLEEACGLTPEGVS